MEPYITGQAIRRFRESRNMTQEELGSAIGVGGKAVSKWETGKGLPDISLLGPLATALGVSLPELMEGFAVVNRNRSGNMARSKIYVCPVCGNVVHASGEAVVSCCGILLPPLEAEEPDGAHEIRIEKVEDERFISVCHGMSKEHYISFIAFASGDRFELAKLYPEGPAEARLPGRGHGWVYVYCNRHGLMRKKV